MDDDHAEEDVLSLKNAFAALPDDVEMDMSDTPTNPAASTVAALFRGPSDEISTTLPQPAPDATLAPAATSPPTDVSTSKAAVALAALFREPSDNMSALADAAPPDMTATSPAQPTPLFGFAAGSPAQPAASSLWGGAPSSQSLWQGMPTLPDSLGSFWNATPKATQPPTAAAPVMENPATVAQPSSLVHSHPLTGCPPGIVPERVEQFNGLARRSLQGPSRLMLSTLGDAGASDTPESNQGDGGVATQPHGLMLAAADAQTASLAAAAALLARQPSGTNTLNRCEIIPLNVYVCMFA